MVSKSGRACGTTREDLEDETIRQTGWSVLEKTAGQGLRFLVLLGLARLLAPSHFGIIAAGKVVTSLLRTSAALGLEPSLVQSDEVDDADFATTAWTSAALAIALVALAFLLAPAAAWVFDSSELGKVLPAMAVGSGITNLAIAPRARLRRSLDFKVLAAASLAGTVVGGAVALGMAASGFGVWSLVAQILGGSAATTAWLWYASDLAFPRDASRERLRELVQFGGPYTGEQLLNFVNRKADDFIIGVFLGETALGFYRIAYSALQALTRVLGGALNAVALPVFSRVSSDLDRLREHFFRATETAGLLAIPACVGFALLADVAIPVLYGPDWMPAVPAARVLSFVALVHALLLFSPSAMYALGRSDLQLRLTALYAALNVLGFLIGVRWGIVGVAAAFAIQNLLTAPLELSVLRRLVPYEPLAYLERLWRPVTAVTLMTAALLWLRSGFGGQGLQTLLWSVGAGAAVYVVALTALGPSYVAAVSRRLLSAVRP